MRTMIYHLPIIPVLQGFEVEEYYDCVELYLRAGVDLSEEPIVGVGSVCRRQSTSDAARIFGDLASLGIRLHGFGVKSDGFKAYAPSLASADSLAWSFNARRAPMLPGCDHAYDNCANCFLFAQAWYERAIARIPS